MSQPNDSKLGKLLIVDDEAAQMTALCNTLQDAGYETLGFTSAALALTALRREEFDVMLTDLMMPGMDGITLLAACQEIDANIVCIVMTGHGAIETAVQAMQAGALDYIQKPFKLRQIMPVLARALTVRRLHRSNAELEQRIRQRTIQLEAANKELEAFSYSVSHDLRAPLRVITGYTDFLAREYTAQLPADGLQAVAAIRSAGQRMGELINDLLKLAQVGQQGLSLTQIQTTQLVRGVIADLTRQNAGRTIDINMSELPDCRADESLLKQVFVNLLSNAFKFTAQCEHAAVEIDGRKQGDELVFCVRDNGAGFDMTKADRLFGVFQRLHRSTEFEGTGVGLSIVQRIVSRHGGRIWATGEPGNGAHFCFCLPVAS